MNAAVPRRQRGQPRKSRHPHELRSRARLSERILSRQRRRPASAHPGRIPPTAAGVPAGASSRHGRVFGFGTVARGWAARAENTTPVTVIMDPAIVERTDRAPSGADLRHPRERFAPRQRHAAVELDPDQGGEHRVQSHLPRQEPRNRSAGQYLRSGSTARLNFAVGSDSPGASKDASSSTRCRRLRETTMIRILNASVTVGWRT